MNAPTIAITSPLQCEEQLAPKMEVSAHAAAVECAGGNPVILRVDQQPSHVLDDFNVQGIIFSGGGDVSTSWYDGDETLAVDRMDPRRDAFEFELFQVALTRKIPILAVCRGMQLINVALGGTLIEDLRAHFGATYRVSHDQVRDAQLRRNDYVHYVAINPGTKLHAILGNSRCRVNSFHHQAIRELAPSLRVIARSEDGIIEAVEFTEANPGFFIGVQWHPEQIPEDPLAQRLYRVFVEACRINRSGGFRDVSCSELR